MLLGFRRWRYFSNCSISTDSVPTCFKYHRNKLYIGTVEGQVNVIDIGFHNAASSVSTGDNVRIFSIDVKEDIVVSGHGDGSLRFYNPADGACVSSLSLTNSPLVFTKILSTPATGGGRLVCWSGAGDVYLVSPRSHLYTIGRWESGRSSAPVSPQTISPQVQY